LENNSSPSEVGGGHGKAVQRARVAVIAVHGVADQKPGETAQTLADLLVVAGPRLHGAGPRYAVVESDALGLRVAPLPPSAAGSRAWSAAPRSADLSLTQHLGKAWRQSKGSDLHRTAAASSGQPRPTAHNLQQPDIELTDFLLAQSQRNEMPDAVYDTQRLVLQRHDAAGSESVHVYEMYWADLSRLAGNLPRILTELFTLIARLSQLGRDTVAAATRQFRADGQASSVWESLDQLQAGLDWLFSRVLAQLMMQLLIVVMAIAPLGWLVGQDLWQDRIGLALACVLPGAAWLAAMYVWAPGRKLALLGALLAVSVGLWLAQQVSRASLIGVSWVLLLAVLDDWLLRLCDARFPLTRACGALMGGMALLAVLYTGLLGSDAGAVAAGGAAPGDRLLLFQTGGLHAMELLLIGSVGCWMLFAPTMLVWYCLGLRAERSRGYAGCATVATGRLALFVSMAFFMTLVMAGWALLHPVLLGAVPGMRYEPALFRPDEFVTDRTAAAFLTLRYQNTTETFSLLAVQVFAVVMYLVIGLLPSLLAEMGLLPAQPQALGRWLTRTCRYLDLLMKLLIGAAVMVVVLVALDMWFTRWDAYPVPELRELVRWVRDQSQQALSPLTLAVTAAGATAAITALGGLLSRYLPGLRAPLDAALDVDNHFREFPRKGIPRSRIFARYAALLRHVQGQGYDRIVIVAHSQGTVLTAELLRYLQARADNLSDGGEAALLGRALAGRVHLMTAGCPLRQLYASRFPVLYPWVMQEQKQAQLPKVIVGPTLASVGVQRWVNIYATGDYVGRWLWSRPPDPAHDRSDTILDDAGRPQDVYEPPASAAAALAQLAQAGAQFDVCVGCGAHTHYFDTDQLLAAALIDGLVTTPWPPQS